MQGGRGGTDDFFGFEHPFAGFGGFGKPGSLISSFFGGGNPFDDPFFNRPFGSMMGPSMFGPSLFDSGGSFFGYGANTGFLEQQAPQHNEYKGPIIEELSSDDEEEGEVDKNAKERNENPRKHSRSSKEPYVQDPDDEMEEKKSKHIQNRDQYIMARPQNHTYGFQSSSVTYGGPNGAYYTSSTTRRTGGDGVAVEESKEADATTGKATHRISRVLRDKGHMVTRKLSDERVDTLQTLHNLNEDELAGFEEAWKGNARQLLPGWDQGMEMLDDGYRGSSVRSRQNGQASRGWALPSTTQQHNSGRRPHGHTQSNSFNGRA